MSEIIHLGHKACRHFSLPRECQENQGHLHHYDHLTIVQAGAVKVFYRKEGEIQEQESHVFRCGEFFPVMRNVYHRIKAMEPNTRYACVFDHRDHEGKSVQEYHGHDEAYDMRDEGTPALQDVLGASHV